MKQKLSWILEALFLILLLGITVLIYAPEQSKHILHIRMIQVTGKNKEKAIEQDSLIFVKTFKENEEPRNNTLISFRAERFGESVILTHMFVKSEVRNQETFYITQAPESSYYDTYETRHEDLIGAYLFHMKYMGRVYEFLQSGMGKVIYGAVMGFLLVSSLFLLVKSQRRDRKRRKALAVSQKPSQEGEHREPVATEPVLPAADADMDIQVNQLEQEILENINAGSVKKHSIPSYRIAGIRKALADDSDADDDEDLQEIHITQPSESTPQTGHEDHTELLDQLLEEEAGHEQQIIEAAAHAKKAHIASDVEETPPEMQMSQEATLHSDYEEEVQPSLAIKQAMKKIAGAKRCAEDTADELVKAKAGVSVVRQSAQSHPVYDTPRHAVPQVVVYPQDAPEDIAGLYNSNASKFEKKIPCVEQLHIQAVGVLEPMINSIRESACEQQPLQPALPKEKEVTVHTAPEPAADSTETIPNPKTFEKAEVQAEKAVPEDKALTPAHDAEDGPDSDLLEEVRREVQELLHGTQASKETQKSQEYPDFNRKYAVKEKTGEETAEKESNTKQEAIQPVDQADTAEGNEAKEEAGIVLKDLDFDCSKRFATLHGSVSNHLSVPVRYIKAEIELYDDFRNVIKSMKWYLCGREFLQPQETREFTYTAYEIYGVYDYHIRILSCKQK